MLVGGYFAAACMLGLYLFGPRHTPSPKTVSGPRTVAAPAPREPALVLLVLSFVLLIASCVLLFRILIEVLLDCTPWRVKAEREKRLRALNAAAPTGVRAPFGSACAICRLRMDHPAWNTDLLRELPCTHIFHAACIDRWILDGDGCCCLCRRRPLAS